MDSHCGLREPSSNGLRSCPPRWAGQGPQQACEPCASLTAGAPADGLGGRAPHLLAKGTPWRGGRPLSLAGDVVPARGRCPQPSLSFAPPRSSCSSQLHGRAVQATRSLPPLNWSPAVGGARPPSGMAAPSGEAVGVGAGGRSLLPRLRLTGLPPTLRGRSGGGLLGAPKGPSLGLKTCGTPGYPPSKQVPTDAPTCSWAPASLQAPPGSSSGLHWLKLDPLPPASSPWVGRLSKKYSVFCK